ncbi:MAG: TIGR00282 family metallophosphoesterase [Acidobacteriaceae bacterium]|nr:TIGR00282 family metallophosphoesterase [Acidobacteriaceae bacterium]MBV9780471.1 TIGR00282 family metallophosphoesterase [Acidobacteriaceae bacterium]
MNILFIGDIFASGGRGMVAEHLNKLISEYKIDLSIANAENSAGGFGITPLIAEELLALGLDVLTGGNHSFDKREIHDYLDRQTRLLRPANYPNGLPGSGVYMATARNGVPYAVLNLQGRAQMSTIDCPFRKADELLAALDPSIKIRIFDFHAELTSEKVAMGWYLDGRATAMIGTHTHIPTADQRILPGGLAYQTDAGMTGPYDSVIGVDKEIILRRFLTGLGGRMEAARHGVELHGAVIEADESTGKAISIRRIRCIK